MNKSVTAFLDLERPWLSERLVAWPILASGELPRESALSVRAFALPVREGGIPYGPPVR
jgi:hypothetical protein